MPKIRKTKRKEIMQKLAKTRMHSSRTRIVRCSSRLLVGGGRLPGRGCLPRGGCLPSEGASAWGCLPRVGCLPREVYIPACTEADTPFPCEQNDRQAWKHYLAPNFVADGRNYTEWLTCKKTRKCSRRMRTAWLYLLQMSELVEMFSSEQVWTSSGLGYQMSLPGAGGGSVPVMRSNVSWAMVTWSPPPPPPRRQKDWKTHTIKNAISLPHGNKREERQLGRMARMLSPYDPDVLSLVTRMFSGPPFSEED